MEQNEAMDDVFYRLYQRMQTESWKTFVLKHAQHVPITTNTCRGILQTLLTHTHIWNIPHQTRGHIYQQEWETLVQQWKHQLFARSKPYWDFQPHQASNKAVQVLQYLFTMPDIWFGTDVDIEQFYATLDYEDWNKDDTWKQQVRHNLQHMPSADIQHDNLLDTIQQLLSMYNIWNVPCQYAKNYQWFKQYNQWKQQTLQKINKDMSHNKKQHMHAAEIILKHI